MGVDDADDLDLESLRHVLVVELARLRDQVHWDVRQELQEHFRGARRPSADASSCGSPQGVRAGCAAACGEELRRVAGPPRLGLSGAGAVYLSESLPAASAGGASEPLGKAATSQLAGMLERESPWLSRSRKCYLASDFGRPAEVTRLGVPKSPMAPGHGHQGASPSSPVSSLRRRCFRPGDDEDAPAPSDEVDVPQPPSSPPKMRLPGEADERGGADSDDASSEQSDGEMHQAEPKVTPIVVLPAGAGAPSESRAAESSASTPRSAGPGVVDGQVGLRGKHHHDSLALRRSTDAQELWLSSMSSLESVDGVNRCSTAVARCVCDERFDYAIGLLVLTNSIFLGVQTQVAVDAAIGGEQEPAFVNIISSTFCAIFTIEFCMRLWVHKLSFFTGMDWRWNLFDFVLVTMQLVEETVALVELASSGVRADGGGSGFVALRILRGLRLARIIRVMRLMHLLSDLRSMIGSIVSTLRSLFWTVLLLVLIMYTAGVHLTQLVSDYERRNPGSVTPGSDLHRFFGSVGRSILTLFMSISGGVDWQQVVDPLVIYISPAMAVAYSGFIAFTQFSMLNVITGIFVDSALRNSREEMDLGMTSYLTSVFRPGQITLPEFEEKVGDPKMAAYFKSIDLDVSEAKYLFQLLDINDTGSVDTQDFVMGCLRLRGPAKSIDLATLMAETRRMKWQLHVTTSLFQEIVESGDQALVSPTFSPAGGAGFGTPSSMLDAVAAARGAEGSAPFFAPHSSTDAIMRTDEDAAESCPPQVPTGRAVTMRRANTAAWF